MISIMGAINCCRAAKLKQVGHGGYRGLTDGGRRPGDRRCVEHRQRRVVAIVGSVESEHDPRRQRLGDRLEVLPVDGGEGLPQNVTDDVVGAVFRHLGKKWTSLDRNALN